MAAKRPVITPRPRKQADFSAVVHLREWLRALGLAQGKIAADAGINEGYVSQLVNREKYPNEKPTVETVMRLAAKMDMPWHLLYEPPPRDPIPLDQIARYPPDLLQRISRERQRQRA